MHIVSLYRYPVKGLSPERLNSVTVRTAGGFPHDRKFAILRSGADFDPSSPTWLAKANFLMLMVHENLAELKTRYDETENVLYIRTPKCDDYAFSLANTQGRHELESFFQGFMPKQLPQMPRLLEASGHMFTDKATKYVSLINLASLRDLEIHWGESLDPLRFRANVYIDGAQSFSEQNWVGRRIKLGNVVMEVVQNIVRCAATNVNPVTGERDRNIPGKLRADFGHKDLGLYLRVAQNGEIHEGDSVTVATMPAQNHDRELPTDRQNPSLMCSACYCLFDFHQLKPEWRRAGDLPKNWHCPDCGSTQDQVVACGQNLD